MIRKREFMMALNSLETGFVIDIIKLAQKHNTDPNEALHKAAVVISAFAAASDLTKFKDEGEKVDAKN